MGVLPLQFTDGVNRRTLRLDGSESFDITGLEGALAPRMRLECSIRRVDRAQETLALVCRLDTTEEVEYFRHGGLLHYALRQRLKNTEGAT
jgi:aconitate hydratase